MVIILCECDYGIGLNFPHTHSRLEQIRLADGRVFWMPAGTAALNPGVELLDEWEEPALSIPWKALFRHLTSNL